MKLPNLIIAGAQKSGTTALVNNLRDHPEAFFPKGREVHFFDKHWERGVDWYSGLYKDRIEKVLADKTPIYMYLPEARERMYKVLPQSTKFIICLRNPIDRAYSQYQHYKRNVPDCDSFLDMFYKSNFENKDPATDFWGRGLYSYQILDMFRYFNASQFKFVLQERMLAEGKQVLDEVFDFIDIDKEYPAGGLYRNKSDYPPLDKKTRFELMETYYIEVNERLKYILPDLDFGKYWKDFNE